LGITFFKIGGPVAILTISRRYGSGGRDIGRAVADRLHYDYVDRRRILADIGKAGQTWGEFAKQYDEKQPSVYERYKWSFRGFVALNQAQILEYALYDGVIGSTDTGIHSVSEYQKITNEYVVPQSTAKLARA
jgi:hypothetical protein